MQRQTEPSKQFTSTYNTWTVTHAVSPSSAQCTQFEQVRNPPSTLQVHLHYPHPKVTSMKSEAERCQRKPRTELHLYKQPGTIYIKKTADNS